MATSGVTAGLEVEPSTLNQMRSLSKGFKADPDGKILKGELVIAIRGITAPGVSVVKSRLSAMPHSGSTPTTGAPLGSTLASKTKTSIRLAGAYAGVSVKIAKTPMIRGFVFAARRIQQKSWRHPVYARGAIHRATKGRDSTWVEQTSPIPDYFDQEFEDRKEDYAAGIKAVVERMLARLAERAKVR